LIGWLVGWLVSWLVGWFIVSYDSTDKQKQYKESSRNKETNCQWT